MAVLPITQVIMAPGSTVLQAGFTLLTAPSSSTGDTFVNTGHEVVMFQNSSSQGAGAAITVTVVAVTPDNFGGAATLHNILVSVPSSSMGLTATGPFPPIVFGNPVTLNYSASGLNVGVFSIAPRG